MAAKYATLEGPGEVAVGGEPERPALGVADPDPLDDRGLVLLGLRFPADHVLQVIGLERTSMVGPTGP